MSPSGGRPSVPVVDARTPSLADDSSRCERCTADGWQCSFERTPAPEHGYVSPLSTATHKARYPSNDSAEHHEHRLPASVSTEVVPSISSSPDGKNSRFNLHPPPLPTTPATCASDDAKDLRYATMLNLMESRDVNGARACPNQGVKLISGTNPLSALLGKELKHTIITNSCSFRTPDPVAAINLSLQRGISIRNCDWEQYYRLRGVPKARLQFLRAIGCFQLPPAVRCTELLEIFFTYIHPMLPVIDRKDFLLCYYGADKPPPLIVLHAVFLAASRYVAGNGQSADGMPETRSHCDEMHAKLRVLIDIDISQERLAVIQAALIASLHWEGREGLNSAIDSLSLAVRACQEMGLHRKLEAVQPVALKAEKQDLLHRRIWWSAYILDRLCAAQEGTPFLINEQDCDVPLLTEADLVGEDSVTVRATMISLSMARLIEDAVRSLYAPGKDHIMLFSLQGVHTRQRLITQLKDLKGHVRNTLLSGQGVEDALKGAPYAVSILCGAILLVQ
ncbi:hypothetical protein BO78DRAFT_381709 [Aspergillus sclerotiicarbonarius CBS 121057]|uniref:Xylanolytic transcriptional activator regulatory domain-containing protein n=1 Tax=Aspergillus sclerotiicarbonarius (strain CBS 121057 / IBT 28362) TaxID=1448318 RepID=A0A319EQL9_ASPSB|nr:hypothetical protein BO78DRAFT_381709 [Aspergillus sclerotiicarbonarius CBS 121057]